MPRARITTPPQDKWHRGIRSLAQVAFVQGLIALWNAFAVTDLTAEQVAAITLVATPLVSFIQNLAEDSGAVPSFGKSPPSTGADPA